MRQALCMALGRTILREREQGVNVNPEGLSEALADICGRLPVSTFDAADIALRESSLFRECFLGES